MTGFQNDESDALRSWNEADFHLPEPSNGYNLQNWRGNLAEMASQGIRVVYSGWGGDPLLFPEPSYATTLLQRGQIGNLLSQLANTYRASGRLPSLGLHTAIRRKPAEEKEVDEWTYAVLNQNLVSEMNVPDRNWQLPCDEIKHPCRPLAYQHIVGPYWPVNFARYNAEISAAPIEFRYPFFDLRVVRFMLRLSALRWCSKKALLRESMVERLPKAVLTRAEAPLAGEKLYRYPSWVYDYNIPGTLLAKYINTSRVTNLIPNGDVADFTNKIKMGGPADDGGAKNVDPGMKTAD